MLRVARRLLASALIVLAGTALPASAQYAQDSLAFDLEHVFELEYATDPQIAPDGEDVVYARTYMDKTEDGISDYLTHPELAIAETSLGCSAC